MSFWPAQPLFLADDEVQVWSASLRYPAEEMAEFASLLTADEKTRAARFIFERDRQRFVAGRGLLRMLLGSYLGVDAARIVFTYGPQRKPEVSPLASGMRLEFNLAHSQDLALFAFGWNRQIGIDLEYVRRMPDEDDFARQFFSIREAAFITSLQGDEKTDAFFRMWTCKEAILKAIGKGLTRPLNQTEVALDGMDNVRIISFDGDVNEAARWQLLTFQPAPGYRASLAGEGTTWKVAWRRHGMQPNGPEPGS